MSAEFEEPMQIALAMAAEARDAGDDPFGAVLLTSGGVLPERNRVVTTSDPTAHSEVMAIRSASAKWGLGSIVGSTLVTSFEPCPMCFGAVLVAGVSHLVIAARRVIGDPPLGDYTVERLLDLTSGGHALTITSGICGAEADAFYASIG
jgi:tRNA(adenine34) deaminase